MKLSIKEDKLEKYSESQMHEYYYIEGLSKNVECKFKIIYGYS